MNSFNPGFARHPSHELGFRSPIAKALLNDRLGRLVGLGASAAVEELADVFAVVGCLVAHGFASHDEAQSLLSSDGAKLIGAPITRDQSERIVSAFSAGQSRPLAAVFPKPEAGPFRSDNRAPVFEVDLMPEPFRGFAKRVAAISGLSIDYLCAGLLAAAAGAIGLTRRVTTVAGCGFDQPPILWIGAIGASAVAKSPALGFARKMIEVVQGTLDEKNSAAKRDWKSRRVVVGARRAAWERDVELAIKNGEEPPFMPDDADDIADFVADRILLGDTTPEAVVKICSGLPRGALVFRDELPGWYSAFNRYQGGGEREMWLEAHEGSSWVSDRVKQGGLPIRVPSFGVSVIGGLQPDKLREFLAGPCDGLAQRFLWFWPSPSATRIPTERVVIAPCVEALKRLRELDFAVDADGKIAPKIVPLSTPALNNLEQFKARNDRVIASLDEARSIRGSLGKADKQVLRLSIILELMAWAGCGRREEPREISDGAMAAAIHMWEGYFAPTLSKVFQEHGNQATRAARDLASWIMSTKAETLTPTQARRDSGFSTLANANDVRSAIDELVEAGWVHPNFSRKGPTAGRVKEAFLVNPNVHTGDFHKYR